MFRLCGVVQSAAVELDGVDGHPDVELARQRVLEDDLEEQRPNS
jgi:hypothetical protein